MAFRVTPQDLVCIGPSERYLLQKAWAEKFEILKREHIRISNEIWSGRRPPSWEALQFLACSSPHFLLDWSLDFSDEAIARKLSQHILFGLGEQGSQSLSGGLEALPYFDTIGDDVMIRAALNWSPREHFQIDEMHSASGNGLGRFIRKKSHSDALFFDALGIALDLIERRETTATELAAALAVEMKTRHIVRPKKRRGKRTKKETVYRRFAVRLFLHEMRDLGFPIGPNDGARGTKTACDAAWIALKRLNKNPPAVQTLRQDWQQWKYKDK